MKDALALMRPIMQQHEHLVALAVASRLENHGHTIDDEVTKHRWAFNRLGQLVSVRSDADCNAYSKYDWGFFTKPIGFTQLA